MFIYFTSHIIVNTFRNPCYMPFRVKQMRWENMTENIRNVGTSRNINVYILKTYRKENQPCYKQM